MPFRATACRRPARRRPPDYGNYATDAAPPKLPAAETPLDAIVFHVGAGSYLEHHALQRAFAEGPRTVCYGAADLADPTAFLEEIMELGA